MTIQLARRLFTVTEYEQMIDAGIFGEEDRVELLDGEIVQMSPSGSRHAACVKRLTQLIVELQKAMSPGYERQIRSHRPGVLAVLYTIQSQYRYTNEWCGLTFCRR